MSELVQYLWIGHVLGLCLWIGAIPFEGVLWCLARRGETHEQRRRARAWMRKLHSREILPGAIVVIGTGAALALGASAGAPLSGGPGAKALLGLALVACELAILRLDSRGRSGAGTAELDDSLPDLERRAVVRAAAVVLLLFALLESVNAPLSPGSAWLAVGAAGALVLAILSVLRLATLGRPDPLPHA